MHSASDEDKEDSRESIQSIRQAVLSYMEGKSIQFRAWRTKKRLDRLKPKPITIEWLEAAILVRVAGRIRPSRTVGLLGILAKMRAEQGEEQEFKDFEALIATYLHPLRLTPHGLKEARFTTTNNTLALNHIGELLEKFDGIGYQVFLNSGTLLGLVRDGRLIEHDDDIDLGIVLKSTNRTEAAREWVELFAQLKNQGLLGEQTSDQNTIYKLNSVGSFEVDLFPCWIERNKVFVYPHTFGDLERSQLLPLNRDASSGYPIPADYESMLKVNYGTDWQKPNPYFTFPWSQQKRVFAEFISKVQSYVDSLQVNGKL